MNRATYRRLRAVGVDNLANTRTLCTNSDVVDGGAMSRFAQISKPFRFLHRGRLFHMQYMVACVACGNEFGSLDQSFFPDGQIHRTVALAPGYHRNALGIFVRPRSPRRATYIPERGDCEHLMMTIGAERLPILVECSRRACRERNLIAKW